MQQIAKVTDTTVPAASVGLLAAVKAKFGIVPNLFATLAQSPGALGGYLQLAGALDSNSPLSGPERERIALLVAQSNGCDYCLAAHSFIGAKQGLSPEEVMAARHGQAADSRADAILKLAVAVLQQRGKLAAASLQAARDAGLNDAAILDVVANVALNVLTNYTNNLAGTEVDFPAAPALA